MQAWELFERGELALLVDSLLNVDNDFDTEEACRFLKVGLLCTQQMLKLRPPMSTVVKMLQGEMEVDDKKIMQPGFSPEFNDVKIRDATEHANFPHASSSCLTNTTYPSLTFTAISDRSP